jgi:hypothetical protein
MLVVKGATLKKQMEHVDRILRSHSFKLHRTATGIITPFPISNFSESGGDVIKYMFPANGTITVCGMFVENMPKSGIDISIIVNRNGQSESKSIFTKSPSISTSPNIKISFADRLIVNVVPKREDEEVSNIWVAFLWIPKVKDADVRNFLIDDLMKLGE